MRKNCYIFAGGGTGGHLFPAIAIAIELRNLEPGCRIIFIGSKDKIESKVVPQYNFEFISIWISGFSRKLNFNLILFPIKLICSLIKSMLLIIKYKPAVVIGTGGYVSGPVLRSAIFLSVPTLLQDHNSYPGITTKLLSKKANEVHIAIEEAKIFLKRKDNVFLSGFPIRKEMVKIDKNEAKKYFNIDINKKVLFVTGGSLGARSINNAVLELIKNIDKNLCIIWQTGPSEFERINKEIGNNDQIRIFQFIKEMNIAYSACDLAITRSGATTIGELINLNVPAILVPFPFAAEDHQTKNAKSISDKGAGILVKDDEISEKLFDLFNDLFNNENKIIEIKNNLEKLSKSNSAKEIAKRIINLAKLK